MADTQVYEKNLGAKSANSIGTSDYVRVVGSDNNSYKQPMNDIGKTILEKYTGSTLAGSAQSAKSAIDTLNSNPLGSWKGVRALTSSDDLNNLTDNGRYLITSSSTPTTANHYPAVGNGSGGFIDIISRDTDQIWQIYSTFDNRIFRRLRVPAASGGTWSNWERVANGSEVDNALSLYGGTAIASNTDLNTLTTFGNYYASTDAIAATLTNAPTNKAGILKVSSSAGNNANTIHQVYSQYNTLDVWERKKNSASGSWTAWSLRPSRTEVDALNSNTSVPSITTLANLYSAGTSLASTHITKFVVINSDVTTALTNGQIAGACRGFITKADANTVDVFMYGVASEKVFIARLTGASTVSKCVIQPTRTEVDTLNSNLATKVGTLTVAEGITDHLVIRQSGNVVSINGYVSGTFAASTNTTIGTISGVSLPNYTLRCRGACGSNAYSTGADAYIGINSSGVITVSPASAGTNVYFSITYITQ